MHLIRGLHNFPSHYAPCVATIGNFDGVHLGHQHMLQNLVAQAQRINLPAVVIIFEPHPAEFFNVGNAPARLTRFREKLLALAANKIDAVLVLRFEQALAQMSATDFIEKILIATLNIRALFVGDDFRFGYQRQGDMRLLQKYAEVANFELRLLPAIELNNTRISSTLIRQLLAIGNLATAANYLGRPYSMLGQISYGAQRGRLINFPTANLQIKRKVSPLLGVYVVEMLGIAATPIPGVANMGNRPTVDGTHILLEVHLFDFDQDIYGRQVQINFLHKLRDEKRFDCFDALKTQIKLDAQQARQLLLMTYHHNN